jgi:hypothetical protein
VTTVEYGLSVLQGIYSEARLDLSEGGQLEKYREDVATLDKGGLEKRWKNSVGRSWNGLMQSGVDREQEEVDIEIEMLTGQLQDLDDIFLTHFSQSGRYFMTASSSWSSVVPMYVEALGKYADEMAQQPGGPPLLKKIRGGLPDKMTWVMMDHGKLHIAPPFPLMTRSAVAVVADSLRDIGLAIYEVSVRFILTTLGQVDTVRPAHLSGAHHINIEKGSQVDHVRPASIIQHRCGERLAGRTCSTCEHCPTSMW